MADEKLKQLKVIDEWHMRLLADLFKGLKAAKEGGETLLDRTMLLYGSNLGDANAHSTTNLPTLFAGGGFKHGRHLAFDRARNSRCCSGWGSRRRASAPRPARCAAWRRPEPWFASR
jgi:hypothetical protein